MSIDKKIMIGIYVRESRDDYGINYETIEAQRDMLVDFAEKNGLGEIYDIYMDDNVSGSVFERDGIKKLKSDVDQKKIDLVVLKDLSRLGRNNARTLLFLDYLEENGVRVMTLDGKYDSSKDNDLAGIETWLNERYLKDISRKTRSSLKYRINRGDYIGTAPYGYKKSQERNRLKIDEEAADVVRKIYSMYREGYGYSCIANYLNSSGYLSPQQYKKKGRIKFDAADDYDIGIPEWSPSAVSRILSSRVYTGDTVQGVSEKISYKSKKTRRLPENMWVLTESTHKGIIGFEEFKQVQKTRELKKSYSGSHKGSLHPFRGKLFCGKCGSFMIARKRKNRPMGYICGSYGKNGRSFCSSHYIRESILKEIIIKELKRIIGNIEVMSKVKNMLSKQDDEFKNPQIIIDKLVKELQNKQRQQEILYMDRLENKISEQLFLRANKNMENSIGRINDKIKSIKQSNKKKNSFEETICELKKDMEKGEVSYEIVSLMVKRIFIFDREDTNLLKNSYLPKGKNMNIDGAIVVDFRIDKV